MTEQTKRRANVIAHALGWFYLAVLALACVALALRWYPVPTWFIGMVGVAMMACWIVTGLTEEPESEEIE